MDETYITLDELCQEEVERDQREVLLERYGKRIRYRVRVPLDIIITAQQRFKVGGKGQDMRGYMAYLLRYLMINPRIESDEQARLLMKADGKLMLSIIGEAVGNIGEVGEEADQDAGESPDSGRAAATPAQS